MSMYCEECHQTEDDPIMLDVEICGCCGGYLTALDHDELRDRIHKDNQIKELEYA